MTKNKKKQHKYYVTNFYKFFAWPTDKSIKEHGEALETWCKERQIKGLIIISPEGFNGTVASTHELIDFKSHLKEISREDITYKDSSTTEHFPFRRMKVKVREEIVTLGDTDINPRTRTPKDVKHLSPKEWHEFINQNPTSQVIDVRNNFEIKMGTFKGAKNWKMEKFTEFPKLIKENDLKKDKPVLMFCTGGIRCEKASLEMINQGYQEIYQLDGGILNYIKEYPNELFKGNCFVFDHRVALDQNLSPSKQYTLCIHCGQPSNKKPFICIQCKEESYGVCEDCWKSDEKHHTCSKNCRHHFEKGHITTHPHKDSLVKRTPKT